MKLEIYESTEEHEDTIYLKLTPHSTKTGHVTLRAVGKNGGDLLSGCILTISPDGTLHKCFGVNERYFQRDARSRIKEV